MRGLKSVGNSEKAWAENLPDLFCIEEMWVFDN